MSLPLFLGAAIGALLGPAGIAVGAAATTGAAIINGLDIKESSNNLKDLYTTEEAMQVLGMSKPTILKKMKEGLIPYEVSGGRGRGSYHIRREVLENYAIRNNIVPNWGNENVIATRPDNKVTVEETIKLKKIQKEEAELELEELELEPVDTIEYKRELIQAKKKIKILDKDIQALRMILISLDSN